MRGIPFAAKMLLAVIGLAAAVPGPVRAGELLTMQASTPPIFRYRVTADNQLILPDPVQLRFSRVEQGLSCTKMVQVGVNLGSDKYFPRGQAPGLAEDPNAVVYTSPISGGAELCNFNFNDTLLTLSLPAGDAGFRDWLKGACLDAALWKDPALPSTFHRREAHSLDGIVVFRPFMKMKNGVYDWKAVSSITPGLKCDTWSPFYCRFPIEAVCDAIPNRPPGVEKVLLSHNSVSPYGQAITINLWAFDDAKVRGAYAVASVGGTTIDTILLNRHNIDSGMTANREYRSGWGASYTVPRNPSISPRTISLTFKVLDVEGAETTLAPASDRQVVQAGIPDMAPPQILGFTANPQALPSAGGAVTISVRASDNLGVGAVELSLIRPDGTVSPMQMPMVGGTASNGEWRTGWNMWPNTGSSELVYQVKATVMDGARNTVSSQALPIAVAGIPVQAVQPQGKTQPQPQGQMPPPPQLQTSPVPPAGLPKPAVPGPGPLPVR